MGASVLTAAKAPGQTTASVPWYVWCAVAAVTSAMVGIHWDISWHRSIGRDTFWTPAHLAIHLCGVLAGISSAYLILSTTFRRNSPLRASSVRMWGFRGPLGAFVAAWGGVAMITSAPFDNWWHNAYGLDVKILSPPHTLLAAGFLGVMLGALLLTAGRRLVGLVLYVSGVILVCLMVLLMELTMRTDMHTVRFYRVVAIVAPLVLTTAARATGYRWAATAVSGFYAAVVMLLEWILPLFPAEPKLGPVYHQVHQFIPPPFPLLLIVPAIALDLLWQRNPSWGPWRQAAVSGPLFLLTFAVAQWPFANFLMSPLARNWLFGTAYFGYYTHPRSLLMRYQFARLETGAAFWTELTLAIAIAIAGIRIGRSAGDWIARVRR